MHHQPAEEPVNPTNSAIPIDSPTPASRPTRLPITRPALEHDLSSFPLHRSSAESTSAILDELRSDLEIILPESEGSATGVCG